MRLNRQKRNREKTNMTAEQVRKVKAEMMLYGVEQLDVAAAVGVDPSAVSHAMAGRLSRSKRIREMIARMVLAAQFKVPIESVLQEMVNVKMKELFGET